MVALAGNLNLNQVRAVVVDDNTFSLEILTQALRGFRISNAVVSKGGEEARKILSSQAFDLILIDDEMPGEDGFELIRFVRGQDRLPNFTAPIIMISAHTPLHNVLRARNAGANMVVKKPVVPAILLDRIGWLARDPRDFVQAKGYIGPDRRFKNGALPDGLDERRADFQALTSDPARSLSQDDIDALFE